ncbi:MAG: glycosyltransferase involved in cell wall biosynthesis [Halioglobus sp.]
MNTNISVLIPARNTQPYIREAITSVLEQTLKPAEIIVYDDNSTDSTAAIIKEFAGQVRYMGPARLGATGARNLLLEHAKYQWIAFQDSDDIWMPQKLEKQMDFLQKNPEFDACLGLAEHFLEPGCQPPLNFRNELLDQPSAQFYIQNLLASRAVFNRVGHFDIEDIQGATSDWFVRARDCGVNIGVVQEIVYRHRWHDTNHCYDFAFQRDMLAILRRSIQRKRDNEKN